MQEILALVFIRRAHRAEAGEPEAAIRQALERERRAQYFEVVDFELAPQQRPPRQADAHLLEPQRRGLAIGGEYLQAVHMQAGVQAVPIGRELFDTHGVRRDAVDGSLDLVFAFGELRQQQVRGREPHDQQEQHGSAGVPGPASSVEQVATKLFLHHREIRAGMRLFCRNRVGKDTALQLRRWDRGEGRAPGTARLRFRR